MTSALALDIPLALPVLRGRAGPAAPHVGNVRTGPVAPVHLSLFAVQLAFLAAAGAIAGATLA